jgi:hypothetical protein
LGVEVVQGPLAAGAQLVPLKNSADARSKPATGSVDTGDIDAWRAAFAALARKEARKLSGAGRFEAPKSDGAKVAEWERLPRIAVYKPWTSSMDEGWLRWTLEYCGLSYASVDNARLRTGALAESFDVLVLPDLSGSSLENGRDPGSVPEEYAGGIEREGRLAIDAFVRGGGRVVAVGRAANWAIELFQLPLKDVARGKEAGEFSCPGSVLRADLKPAALHGFGAGPLLAGRLFFSASSAWAPSEAKSKDAPKLQTMASFADSDVLYSGWIRSPEIIAGKAAWVRADVDSGSVQLFSFSPYYRSWSQGTFHWLLRAIMDVHGT